MFNQFVMPKAFKGLFLAFIVFCCTALSYGQNIVSGIILDASTKEPLPFATIIVNPNSQLGTTTDIDGKFYYSGKETITSIVCSYIGYTNKVVNINTGQVKNLKIELVFASNELQELIITPGENPANAIMRRVIANKELNNPENITAFKYKSYNKTIYDFRFKGTKDSLKIKERLKGGHVFIMESVTERKYLKPDMSEEVVLATRVSGLKNPTFASLATDLQPFSFYKENLKFLNVNYLNPISKGSLNKYRFTLQDTLYRGSDTIYVISYKPLSRKNFEALTGLLYINTKKYAVQNVTAEPYEKGKIDIKIRQQYTYTKEGYWFPEQLDYTLEFLQFPKKDLGMYVQGKSYIDSVEINTPLQRKNFAFESIWMEENAAQKDSLYWDKFRRDKLDLAEKATYKVVDSIGEVANLDGTMRFMEQFVKGRIPAGPVDIDISKVFGYNKYEESRWGLGLYTNEKLFKKLSLGGFFGYGSRDHKWKYGGEAIYTFSKRKEFTLGAKYQDNLVEVGNHGYQYPSFGSNNWRGLIASLMDRIEEGSINIAFRPFRYAKWNIGISSAKITPMYDYTFIDNGKWYKSYYNTELTANFKFAFGEKIINAFNQNMSLGTKYPTLYLSYARGIKGILGSDFNYNKIEMAVEQSFYTKNFGKTAYRLEAGYIDKPLSYGLLFTGEGGYDKKYPLIMKNSFQTMTPYEFLSDRYVNLFTSHNFGGLLLKTSWFQPEISIHNNFGWGNLSNQLNHSFITYKTKDKLFMETGLQLDNVIKLNYVNTGYMTFGAGVYYRYGTYSLPEFSDNLAFKLTFNFTIK